jgi:bacillolysin
MKRSIVITCILVISFAQSASSQNATIKEFVRDKEGAIKKVQFKEDSLPHVKDSVDVLKTALKMEGDDALRQTASTTGARNKKHIYYEQYYKGINVVNGVFSIHAKDSKIESLTGSFHKIGPVNVNPSLTESEALAKAKNYVNAKKYEWEVKANNKKEPTGKLRICKDYLLTNSKYSVVYQFEIHTVEPYSARIIFVDATNGKIVHEENLIKAGNTPGTATTLYSGVQSIIMDSYSSGYRLQESRNSTTLATFNLSGSTSVSSSADFSNSTTTWPANNGATDVHWGLEKVSDYWLTVQGRNSLNGSGGPISACSNYGTGSTAVAAYWDAANDVAIFGAGNGSTTNALTSLDVVAHETGHAVTYYCVKNNFPLSSGVGSSGEAGQIDEGLSDIWGSVVEYYYAPSKSTWLIGEEIMANGYSCLRSARSPKTEGYGSPTGGIGHFPDTYQGSYWYTGSDNHINATVISHWFYLLCNGGKGVNDNSASYSVSPISIADAAAIVYVAERDYLIPDATFADLRSATENAANDLFGCSDQLLEVQNAWHAVGVGTSSVNATYSISGGDVCTSRIFTVGSVPGGGSILWKYSPSSGVITLGSASTNPTTITSTGIGNFTIYANVQGTGVCAQTPRLVNLVSGGAGPIAGINTEFVMLHCNVIEYRYIVSSLNATNYKFYARDLPSGFFTLFRDGSDSSVTSGFGDASCRPVQIKVEASNACTVNPPEEGFVESDVCYPFVPEDCTYGRSLAISPNPASSDISLEIKDEPLSTEAKRGKHIQKIRIVDKVGNIKKLLPGNNLSKIGLTVNDLPSDIYTIMVFDGKLWYSAKLIKAK